MKHQSLPLRKKLKEIRAKKLKSAEAFVREIINEDYRKKINLETPSQTILSIRSLLWEEYKKLEQSVTYHALKSILYESHKKNDPIFKENLKTLQKEIGDDSNTVSNLAEIASHSFSEIYELSKSITQSRRSRAGGEFQAIISLMMEIYGFEYDSQAKVGKNKLSEAGFKMVDGVFPSLACLHTAKERCCIFTLKTSLRERWEEVVSEVERTKVPLIYLLTLDLSISKNVVMLMKDHNIMLVTLREFKEKNPDVSNILSYEELFLHELPSKLEWWKRKAQTKKVD